MAFEKYIEFYKGNIDIDNASLHPTQNDYISLIIITTRLSAFGMPELLYDYDVKLFSY